MDQTRQQRDDQSPPVTGIAGDMKRLHGDATATAAELREFVSSLKGRSPAEVLGAIGESSLVQAVAQAAVGCVVLLVLFTVGPYLYYGPAVAAPVESSDAAAASGDAPSAAAAETDAVAEAADGGAEPDAAPDVEQAARAMGIDEARPADPKVNPLDSDLDRLLDGVE